MGVPLPEASGLRVQVQADAPGAPRGRGELSATLRRQRWTTPHLASLQPRRKRWEPSRATPITTVPTAPAVEQVPDSVPTSSTTR